MNHRCGCFSVLLFGPDDCGLKMLLGSCLGDGTRIDAEVPVGGDVSSRIGHRADWVWVWVGSRIDAELPVGDVMSRSRRREVWVWVWGGTRIDAELLGTRIDGEGPVGANMNSSFRVTSRNIHW